MSENGWVNSKAQLEQKAKAIEPSSRIVVKDDYWLGRLHTKMFGDCAITIGSVQAYPSWWNLWEVEDCIAHESEHSRQYRLFGFGLNHWLGLIPFAVAYLFVFFPIFLAWPRYRLELAADTQQMKYMLRRGYPLSSVKDFVDRRISVVSGWDYKYAWFRPLVRRGYLKKYEEVVVWYMRSE